MQPITLIENKDVLYQENNIYQEIEPFSSIKERVKNFVEDIKQNYANDNIMVVTHGDIILGFQEYFNRRNDGYPKTCELTIFEI